MRILARTGGAPATKFKKGDTVVVITGKDGKQGEIQR